MRVAGFGMRAAAGPESLRAALEAAGGADMLAALPQHEARIAALADALGLPFRAVAEVAGTPTLSRSARVAGVFGTGSVAEAVALVAAGPGAALTGPRVAAPDGNATCAVAEIASPLVRAEPSGPCHTCAGHGAPPPSHTPTEAP